jgi:hypothetical protein
MEKLQIIPIPSGDVTFPEDVTKIFGLSSAEDIAINMWVGDSATLMVYYDKTCPTTRILDMHQIFEDKSSVSVSAIDFVKLFPDFGPYMRRIVMDWMRSHVDQQKSVVELHAFIAEAMVTCGSAFADCMIPHNLCPNLTRYDCCWANFFFSAMEQMSSTDPIPTDEEMATTFSQLKWGDVVVEFWYNNEKNIDFCMKCANEQTPEMLTDFYKMTKYSGLLSQTKATRGFEYVTLKCDSCGNALRFVVSD